MDEVSLRSEALVPTDYGEFRMMAFAQMESEKMPHLAIVSPSINVEKPVLLRIHSECMTGDVFQSKKCDCGEQLEWSLKQVAETNGLVIYLRQEGRGIGLIEKLKAYKLQQNGLDTVDANLALGHQADSRDYQDAVTILKHLNISIVNLLTNNPEKLDYLVSNGIQVENRVPIVLPTKKENLSYFATKKNRMGHLF
jgi:GTP cyclohydrolase II